MGNVTVVYDSFCADSNNVEEITFNMLPNTVLKLAKNGEDVTIVMMDADTDNTELSGVLDLDTLNNLIKSLSIFKRQMKTGGK